MPTYRLQPYRRNLYFWMSCSIKSSDVLEDLHEGYRFSKNIPEEKLNKYLSILKRTDKKKILLVAQAGDEAERNEFITFSFWIDRRLLSERRSLPRKAVVLPPPMSEAHAGKGFLMQRFSIKIPGFKGRIVILVSKHTGALSHNVVIGAAPPDPDW